VEASFLNRAVEEWGITHVAVHGGTWKPPRHLIDLFPAQPDIPTLTGDNHFTGGAARDILTEKEGLMWQLEETPGGAWLLLNPSAQAMKGLAELLKNVARSDGMDTNIYILTERPDFVGVKYSEWGQIRMF
jgi:hypothetical protein